MKVISNTIENCSASIEAKKGGRAGSFFFKTRVHFNGACILERSHKEIAPTTHRSPASRVSWRDARLSGLAKDLQKEIDNPVVLQGIVEDWEWNKPDASEDSTLDMRKYLLKGVSEDDIEVYDETLVNALAKIKARTDKATADLKDKLKSDGVEG